MVLRESTDADGRRLWSFSFPSFNFNFPMYAFSAGATMSSGQCSWSDPDGDGQHACSGTGRGQDLRIVSLVRVLISAWLSVEA